MEWIKLNSLEQIEEIKNISRDKYVLIFKHSTRCSISSMALDRLQRSWSPDETKNIAPFYLDLISCRDVSNEVSSKFNVPHESPQVLLIHKAQCIYDNSHMGISYNELLNRAKI